MFEQTASHEINQRPLTDFLRDHSEGEFRRLLENLPAGAYMCDPEGLITYFNQRAVELWGRAPALNHAQDRFCGSFKLFSADGAPIRHDQCWMALALQENREYNGHEIVIERPDGYRQTALAYANPIRDEAGELLGAVNVLVDINERKQAEEALRQAHAELEQRVAERTAALTTSNKMLQHLSQHILKAEEEERKRLSRELHDSVGQMTNALLINLSMIQNDLPADNKKLLADMEAACELVYKINDELRSISHMLRPPELEMMGLHEALSELCQELSRFIRQPVVYEGTAVPLLPDNVTITFYRFVQEALNNAVKHAQASEIKVLLTYQEDELQVTVEDNGVGFDVAARINSASQGGIGLMSIRERLEMLGATMEIHSAPGGGTRLVASYPHTGHGLETGRAEGSFSGHNVQRPSTHPSAPVYS